MLPGVEPRVLEYVVAVAEELHFTRAAEKLHVSQPSLSRQIRDLESSLGTRLFERTKQFVRLTAAGVAFVREAREALLHIERAINLAKAATQPESFSLGYSPYVSRRLVTSVRDLFTEKFNRVHLALAPVHGDEQIELIRKGTLDGGLTPLPVAAEAIAVQSLGLEPLVVVLPESHRLGRMKTLRLRDLKNMPMVAVIQKLCPQLHHLRCGAADPGFPRRHRPGHARQRHAAHAGAVHVPAHLDLRPHQNSVAYQFDLYRPLRRLRDPVMSASPESRLTAAAEQYLEQYGSPIVTNSYLRIAVAVLALLCLGTLALAFRTQKMVQNFKLMPPAVCERSSRCWNQAALRVRILLRANRFQRRSGAGFGGGAPQRQGTGICYPI